MKPLHDKLSPENQKKHFRHELGLSDHYPRQGVTDKYREGWERIWGNKKHENEKPNPNED